MYKILLYIQRKNNQKFNKTQLRQVLTVAAASAVSFSNLAKCDDELTEDDLYFFLAVQEDLAVNEQQYQDIKFDSSAIDFINTYTAMDEQLTSAYLEFISQINTVPWADRISSEISYLKTVTLESDGSINTADPEFSKYFYNAGPYTATDSDSGSTSSSDSLPASTSAPSSESAAESTTEPTTESAIELTSESTSESTTESTSESTSEPTTESTTEPTTESTPASTSSSSSASSVESTDLTASTDAAAHIGINAAACMGISGLVALLI